MYRTLIISPGNTADETGSTYDNLEWKANEFEHVGLIAGGTGITPMYQLLQAIDANPQDKTKATLLFANVSEDDILLKEAFADFQKRKPDQFKIEYVIEKPSKSWKGLSGYIGHDALAKNLPMPGHGDKIKIFVCGQSRTLFSRWS